MLILMICDGEQILIILFISHMRVRYHPCFYELPEGMRARLAQHKVPEHWSEEAGKLITPLLPQYEGDAPELVWNRTPGDALV